MTCTTMRCWILLSLLAFTAATAIADDRPAPQPGQPKIQPGPSAPVPQIDTPPQPGGPETQPPPAASGEQPALVDPGFEPGFDPGARVYSEVPGQFPYEYGPYGLYGGGPYPYGYSGMGFNFGYGYRPLGYAFWPRYGAYWNFNRYFANPYQFYAQPYMWRPYWGYQRYRMWPTW